MFKNPAEFLRRRLEGFRKYYLKRSIQLNISLSFTLVAVCCMLALGSFMYGQFQTSLQKTIIQENKQILDQISLNVSLYTNNMMLVFNSMYYKMIRNTDLADSSNSSLNTELNLTYTVNKDSLISIACFSRDGRLIAAMPNSAQKEWVDVGSQDWFIRANDDVENLHFSTPHVQNLFRDSGHRYPWVISLSRAVDLTDAGENSRGVLLVDMNYSGIRQIFTQTPGQSAGMMYLIDPAGNIIYHPKQNQIYSGLFSENNEVAAKYADGIHEEVFEGEKRHVIVKTAAYTGWKLIIVIPNSEFGVGAGPTRMFVMELFCLAILIITLANAFVSSRVAGPIKRLERSVKALDEGELNPDIYIGGPYEIERLGKAINKAVAQIRNLMDDIIREQEEKRKSEFEALQSQIHPHFLYNTLDSIVWMIESERHKEAISMVTALAQLFRISLTKGSNIIPLTTELNHAKYYLHIQNIRYKNKFTVVYDISPGIEYCTTIKLIIQPLVENAIYHAMELMDGDGVITISAWEQEDDVYVEVKDNGLGMSAEKVKSLLGTGSSAKLSNSKGSGIGVQNVHQRVQLYYGPRYGLEIESELDVGTSARVHLPKVEDHSITANGGNGSK